MTLEQLQSYCLAKPGSSEETPFGDSVLVYKVGGKMFALLSLDDVPPSINLKCDPELAVELRERYEAVVPGYHQNKTHWNTVISDGSLSPRQIQEMIDHSYELVFSRLSRKVREEVSGG